jgi:hypothetical protein
MRRQVNRAYKLHLRACTDCYESVQLQSWFLGARTNYWIVRASGGCATAIPTAIQGCSTSALDELHRLEQEEIQQLERLEQDCIA